MASDIVNPPFPQQSGSAPYFGVRAWVNFNGTGTVAIRASGNVSSITDNGTGDYTINFTTALPNANYGVFGIPNSFSASNSQGVINLYSTNADGTGTVKTTSACRILVANASTGSAVDYAQISVAFVG
jgi:hypothetical protein